MIPEGTALSNFRNKNLDQLTSNARREVNYYFTRTLDIGYIAAFFLTRAEVKSLNCETKPVIETYGRIS